MNPENNTQMSQPVAINPEPRTPHPVNQVTTVSKYLALALFVLLPFVGGYVGYRLAPEKLVDMRKEWNLTEDMQLKDLKQIQAELIKQIETYTGTSTPLAPTTNVQDFFPIGTLVYQDLRSDTNLTLDEYVTYLDEEASRVASLPYLSVIVKNSDFIILTAKCFAAKACANTGLYKYDVSSSTLSTLKASSYYDEMMSNGVLSPDKTKFILLAGTSEINGELIYDPGLSIGYVDFLSGEYSNLFSLPSKDNKRFALCDLACTPNLKWNGNSLVATVYELSPCSYSNPPVNTAVVGYCEPIIATSTMTFEI